MGIVLISNPGIAVPSPREISARISSEGFEYLDAPIKRVASLDSPIAYSSVLENELLVQTEWIEIAIDELIKF